MRKPAYNAEQNDESHSFDSRNTKIETTTSQCKYIVVISEEKERNNAVVDNRTASTVLTEESSVLCFLGVSVLTFRCFSLPGCCSPLYCFFGEWTLRHIHPDIKERLWQWCCMIPRNLVDDVGCQIL
jgi:hypothetical protein